MCNHCLERKLGVQDYAPCYCKETTTHENMIGKIVGVVFLLLSIMLFSIPVKEPELHVGLGVGDSYILVQMIGEKGYKQALKNGCIRYIEHYINEGEWLDQWCAVHYNINREEFINESS